MRTSAITILTCVVATAPVGAATLNVPGTHPTIQSAISAASNGDVVLVAPGTYTENLNFLGKAITVKGQTGAAQTTVLQAASAGPVVTFGNGEQSTTKLQDMRITGANGFTGGGIGIIGASPWIERCWIGGNSAQKGAGFSVTSISGQPLFLNCVLYDNDASVEGGAFHVDSGATPVLVNCSVVGNSAPVAGAGVVQLSAGLIIQNSIVYHNGASPYQYGGFLDVTFCDFEFGIAGTGNISTDPFFTDWTSAGLRLKGGSPCIDAANNTSLGTTADDIVAMPRYMNDPSVSDTGDGSGPLADMGAFEYVPTVRYVRSDASPGGSGLTWSGAHLDLQDALDEAAADPQGVDEIWVMAGTYKPDRGTGDRTMSFELQSGLDIRGGYDGTELLRDARQVNVNVTTLGGAIGAAGTADNSYHVVHADGVSSSAKLSGFVIQKGNASGTNPGGDGAGPAIYMTNSSPVISDCWIRLNESAGGATAVYALLGSPRFRNCRFNANVGGGSTLRIAAASSPADVVNCLLHGNQMTNGAALDLVSSTVTVANTTVWGNTSGNLFESGISVMNSTIDMSNSISWGNTSASGVDQNAQLLEAGGTLTLSYSTIQEYATLGGVGNNGWDPMFVDADGADDTPGTADDDLRPRANSRMIDAGSNVLVPSGISQDLDREDRFVDDTGMLDAGVGPGDVVDRGAYEFDGTSCMGDITGDGSVGFADLNVLLAAWGSCPVGQLCLSDLNLDAGVGFADLSELLAQWGPCP